MKKQINKQEIYEYLTTIPKGKVVTYGQIACYLGNKNLARVVGNILHKNPDPENIPCHRVVNQKGKASCAYAFGGIEEQRRRLEVQAANNAQGDEEAMVKDDDYILAMEYGMPPISGWGMGIDRVMQVLTGVPNIKDNILFPLLRPIEHKEN